MKAFDFAQITFDDLFRVRSDVMTEQALIERQLKRGSGFENGKKRILAKFAEHPSHKAFADFLRDEYGCGGYGVGVGGGREHQHHDSKGIKMDWRSEGNNLEVFLSWTQVAEQISKLILRGEYNETQQVGAR